MERGRFIDLARRMVNLIETDTTDLAPSTYTQSTEVYRSLEIEALEKERIFAVTPMFIGMSNEIAEPGSYFTRDLVGTPFLAVRDKQGQVRLFLNACRHRGAKVAQEPCGQASRFTCPFHAWTYGTDGKLIGVPEPEGFDDLDRAGYALVELPVAEKYGLIFGCATPGVEVDVDALLGGLGPEMAEWHFENFEVFGEPHVHDVEANWKYTFDTFNENYHFAYLHRNTLGDYLVSRRQLVEVFGRNVRMVSALKTIEDMRQQPESEWNPFDHLSVQYRLFPSVTFSVYPGYTAVFWVVPGRGPKHTMAFHMTYVSKKPETEDELAKVTRAVTVGCKDVLDNEDFWAAAQAQYMMQAPGACDHFLMGKNEPALQHFNRMYNDIVAGKAVGPEGPNAGARQSALAAADG